MVPTVEAAASRLAEATEASVVTLALSFDQSQAEAGSSMTPTAKSVRRIRLTELSTAETETLPSFSFVSSASSFM